MTADVTAEAHIYAVIGRKIYKNTKFSLHRLTILKGYNGKNYTLIKKRNKLLLKYLYLIAVYVIPAVR